MDCFCFSLSVAITQEVRNKTPFMYYYLHLEFNGICSIYCRVFHRKTCLHTAQFIK